MHITIYRLQVIQDIATFLNNRISKTSSTVEKVSGWHYVVVVDREFDSRKGKHLYSVCICLGLKLNPALSSM